MISNRYYDPDGKPYEGKDDSEIIAKWWKDFETVDDRRILKKTPIEGGEVSTVWLGLDHSFGGRVPKIYETMVFGVGDYDMERYGTRKEALEGHDRMVRKWTP